MASYSDHERYALRNAYVSAVEDEGYDPLSDDDLIAQQWWRIEDEAEVEAHERLSREYREHLERQR